MGMQLEVDFRVHETNMVTSPARLHKSGEMTTKHPQGRRDWGMRTIRQFCVHAAFCEQWQQQNHT